MKGLYEYPRTANTNLYDDDDDDGDGDDSNDSDW